jgi:hypothetical protein
MNRSADPNKNVESRVYAAPEVTPPGERRRHPCYLLTRPVITIPVLADGSPDEERVGEGYTIDVSAGGMSLRIDQSEPPRLSTLVVGVESESSQYHFSTVRMRNVIESSEGKRIGVEFVEPDRCVFRPEQLQPWFDARTFSLAPPANEEALTRWCGLGVTRPVVTDYVQVCSACQSLPTFRHGCRKCGSARLGNIQLIHHFACAHVGFVEKFEQHGDLMCPKCRAKHLVVGADFEYLAGPYHCLDCNWRDSTPEHIAQCLRCGMRCPASQLSEHQLIGYHVHRLDPLVLIDSVR